MKFALRSLLRSPGFTIVAVFTLALAIGVNSAIFSLIDGILLRPVIRQAPEQVVNVFTAKKGASKDYRQFSHAEYLTLRGAKDTFAEVAAMNPILAGIGQDQTMRRSFSFMVSENYFSTLGTTPAAGRFFSAEESKPNSGIPVVIVTYQLWQHYGGAANFVGSTLRINGQPHTVIGVTRKDFSGLNALLAPAVWLPLGMYTSYAQSFNDNHEAQDLASLNNFSLNLTARLNPGVTLENLTARLPALAQSLSAVQPPDNATERELQVEPPSRFSISTQPSGDSSPFPIAAILLGMSGCVLLIACLNLANMLLARGTARSKEIAIRLALGASRGQIVRQLVTEGFLLSLTGGTVGLLLSLWSNDLLLASLESLFSTMNFSVAMDSTPSPAVLGMTLLFATFATVLFAVGPALRASRTDLVPSLKQQGTDTGRLNRFFAGRQILVMAQIALSFMLLFSAGLFVRGALVAGNTQLGFEPRGQIVTELDFSLANIPAATARRTMFAALDRLAQVPGATAAGISTQLPYGNVTNMSRFVDAREAASARKTDSSSPEPGADAIFTAISDGYLKSMGVPLLRGRDITAAESRDEKSPRVVVIDETLAQKLFPKQEALGQHLRYTQPPADGSPAELEIVGICAPHRKGVLQKNDIPRVFVPLAQAYQPNVFIHTRFAAAAEDATIAGIPGIRDALRQIDPTMPILSIAPMTSLLERNIELWLVRLGAALFGIFGGVALLLAIVGVYGVKTYLVSRRTREIGIRMAIGAHPRDVFRLIIKQSILQTALALGVGLLLSLGAGKLLASLLYRVSPFDLTVLVLAATLLALASLTACYLPARRATKVNPLDALRAD